MSADNYYLRALANFKTARILFKCSSDDEQQLTIAGYHLQQALELAIKYILLINGVPIQKNHDIDQLIQIAKEKEIDLYLTEYLKEKSDVITLWETKSRYVLGFKLEAKRIEETISELEKYFDILSKKIVIYDVK